MAAAHRIPSVVCVATSALPAELEDLLDNLPCLEERERDILKALLAGETLRPIGRQLGISGEAVRYIAEKAIRRIATELRPGVDVQPGAVSRFQALSRAECSERFRSRAFLVTRAELHASRN